MTISAGRSSVAGRLWTIVTSRTEPACIRSNSVSASRLARPRHLIDMPHHRLGPVDRHAPLRRQSHAPVAQQEQRRRPRIRRFDQPGGGIQHMRVERPDKALLGAERDHDARRACGAGLIHAAAIEASASACAIAAPTSAGIGADASQPGIRLARAHRRDAAHRRDDGRELADAVDPRLGFAEPLQPPVIRASCPTIAASRASCASSSAPPASMAATISPACASSAAEICVRSGRDRLGRRIVQRACVERGQQRHLIGPAHRAEARLGQHGADARAPRQRRLEAPVGHAAETGEHLQLQELRVIEPDAAGHLPQRRFLRLAADPADAEADIHGRR